MRYRFAAVLLLSSGAALFGQEVRPKDVREIAKSGSAALPRFEELLKPSSSTDVRIEVVKQITELHTPRCVDLLILATRDNDPEVQIRATDGLVNFYLPGYVQTGLGASLKRVGTGLKSKFTDTNDQVIDPFVEVRPDAVTALGALVRGGGSKDVRANAARGVGILRGKAAVPDLLEAAHSKDGDVIYESLIALQKIGDRSAGPRIAFLLHDLDTKVQLAAIETTGLLQNQEALPDLADVINRARDTKVKREALLAMARMPAESSRGLFTQYLSNKDERMRGAAAEGLGRLGNPQDLPLIEKASKEEEKTSPRLSMAFAQVKLGRTEVSEFSPLQTLVNTLNKASYKGEAQPLLAELARDARVRKSLYGSLASGTRDEKVGLCGVLAASGDQESVAELQKLNRDPDPEVQKEALRAVRTIQNRL
jgi:HEAT repeat protein